MPFGDASTTEQRRTDRPRCDRFATGRHGCAGRKSSCSCSCSLICSPNPVTGFALVGRVAHGLGFGSKRRRTDARCRRRSVVEERDFSPADNSTKPDCDGVETGQPDLDRSGYFACRDNSRHAHRGHSPNDAEALEAFDLLSQREGIIPALESAHAVSHAVKLAKELGKGGLMIVNLSGRGDKDVDTVATLKQGGQR